MFKDNLKGRGFCFSGRDYSERVEPDKQKNVYARAADHFARAPLERYDTKEAKRKAVEIAAEDAENC